MSKLLWNVLKACPAFFGASFLLASSAMAAEPSNLEEFPVADVADATLMANQAIAQVNETAVDNTATLEQIQQYTAESQDTVPMGQVTNVAQFRDVQPTDWAYEALARIVERYGCLQGYPDGTFRGNRALSRYEFAAGLNACLQQIENVITTRPDGVTRQDFDTLRRLVEDFRTEIGTLGTRLNTLEGRTAFLENRQFSTTTRLRGEAIVAVSDVFGDTRALPSTLADITPTRELDSNTILGNRLRLNFDTSFSGQDLLRTRLQARNIVPFGTALTGTNMSRLGFDGDNGNNFELSKLYYRLPLSNRGNVILETVGAEFNENIEVFNPGLDSSSTGAISRFGRFNPIYRQSRDGASATVNYNFTPTIGASVAYALPDGVASNPARGGLFNGSYAAIGQLAFRPSANFNVGLTYARSFNRPGEVQVSGSTGSIYANQPFGGNIATAGNHYGLQSFLRLSPNINLSGWVGYTEAIAEDGTATVREGSTADIWNYAVGLSFPNVGKTGNLAGLIFGVPPRVARNDVGPRRDRDVSYHLEGFFRYRLTDNIDITPGLFVILNPEHNDNNNTQYVGTLRTTIRF